MTPKEVVKELGTVLIGPALWLALLLLVASSRAQGGSPAQDFGALPSHQKVGQERLDGVQAPTEDRDPSVAAGHLEVGHRVQNPARELHLHALARQGATPHASVNDRLVSIDRVLDHAAPTAARSFGPLPSAESPEGRGFRMRCKRSYPLVQGDDLD